jgi:hypothetical protein
LSSSAKADDPVNLRRVGQSQPLGLLDARFRGHDKGHVGPEQINKHLTKQVRPSAPDSFLSTERISPSADQNTVLSGPQWCCISQII